RICMGAVRLGIVDHAVRGITDGSLGTDAWRPVAYSVISFIGITGDRIQIAAACRIVCDIFQLALRHHECGGRFCREARRIEKQVYIVAASLKTSRPGRRLKGAAYRSHQQSPRDSSAYHHFPPGKLLKAV